MMNPHRFVGKFRAGLILSAVSASGLVLPNVAIAQDAPDSATTRAIPASPALWMPAGLPDAVSPQVLLITDASLAEAWQPFAAFKTALGRPTAVITVQTIAECYEGQDIQQKIRAAVLDHIERFDTQFIILGGDSTPRVAADVATEEANHVGEKLDGAAAVEPARRRRAAAFAIVPDRDTLHREMGYRDLPSDLYYLSPEGFDWDANDDGVYGDWETDRTAVAYGHPSGATIGRIPVRTVNDVAAYTRKIVAYETRYPSSDFARSMIYTNTVDASEPKVRRSWDDYLSPVWTQGQVFRFLHTETAWDESEPADFALNARNWVQTINNQSASKMHMHGHGFLPAWVLEHSTGDTYVDGRVVARLTNEDAYLVMTTVSCFTGQYDDGDRDPSIAEVMLRAPERGAVIIIAPSREGVPIFHNPPRDYRLMVTEGKLDGTTESMTRFWMNGLSPRDDGSYLTAGEAFMAMKNDMTEHAERTAGYHWCQCELNFLGDPTLDLRATDPITAEFEAPDTLNADAPVVQITTNLIDHPGAIACVWKADELYEVIPIEADGTFEIKTQSITTGEIRFTLSGPCVNAVAGAVTVE